MSKTIRFLGGPANQILRAVPDKCTRVVWQELDLEDWKSLIASDPSSEMKITYHEYLEAFPGAAYFKYQGLAGSDREVEAETWLMRL